MIKRTEQTPLSVHGQVTSCPDCWCADIAGEYCIFGSQLVEHSNDILRMNRFLSRSVNCKLVQTFSGLLVMFKRRLQVPVVLLSLELWQQGLKSRLRVANQSKVDLGAPAQLLPAKVYLHNRRILRIEMLIWKI